MLDYFKIKNIDIHRAATIFYVFLFLNLVAVGGAEFKDHGLDILVKGVISGTILLVAGFVLHLRNSKYSDLILIGGISILPAATIPAALLNAPEGGMVILLTPIITTLTSRKRWLIAPATLVTLAIFIKMTGLHGAYLRSTILVDTALGIGCLFLARMVLERANQQVEDQVEQLKDITDNIDEVFFLVDISDRQKANFLYISPAVEKIWGDAPEAFLGKTTQLFDYIVTEDKTKVNKAISSMIKKDESTVVEFRIERPNKEVRYIEARLFPIKEDDESYISRYSGIALDVTAAKKIDQGQKDFISLTSHHIRTPLSIIRFSAEMLAASKEIKHSAASKQYIDQIIDANQHAIQLANKLLEIARAESGHLTLYAEPVSVNDIAEHVIKGLKSKIEDKKIKLHFSRQSIPEINIDKELFTSVCDSLISNAIAYTPSEKGDITVKLDFSGGNLIFEVSDNGLGIPKEEQSRVFTRFYRGSNVTNLGPIGQGLGLHLTQIMVNQLRGNIKFNSKLGEGTTFTVQIPIKEIKLKAGAKPTYTTVEAD